MLALIGPVEDLQRLEVATPLIALLVAFI